MINTFRRHRRSTRRGLVVLFTAALLAPVMVAQPAGAGPAGGADLLSGGGAAAATSALAEDLSGRMPRTAHNEITGDFLKKGYDQRMVVENGNLNIYDAAFKGGGLLRSTSTDLQNLVDSQDYWSWVWAQLPIKYRLAAIPLAWTPDGLYMAGRLSANRGDHYLYRLPPDGSCAQKSCAIWAQQLPDVGAGAEALATALAVGEIGSKDVLAVGLNTAGIDQSGVAVVDPANGAVLGRFHDYHTGQSVQEALTGLDWDDSGSGLLAMAVATSNAYPLHAVRVSADGTFSNHTSYTVNVNSDNLTQMALSVAVGHRPDGSPVIAYGMNDGGVKLWDPAVSSSNLLADLPGSGQWNTDAGFDAVTFTDRIDGTVGVPDLVAVSSRSNTAQVLRYDGSTTLKPLAVAPNGGTSTDIGGIRAWFPGYKTGVVEFWNASPTDPKIQLDFATRPNAGYGCWFAQGFNGNPVFPTDPVILDSGLDAKLVYTIATQTAGTGGGCAATDFTGQWAAYVVATPLDRPADRTVAKLVLDRSGNLTVQSVGGSLTFRRVAPDPGFDGPLGRHRIVVSAPARAGLPASLKVTGTVLDPFPNDRPVYRLDVSATTWQLPVSTPARTQTIIPPLRVVGITNTDAVIDLGRLVPQGQPSRSTSGTVTLSPVSFYWQNPYDRHDSQNRDKNLRYIMIRAQDPVTGQGVNSNLIDLNALTIPAVGTTISAVVVCPAAGSTSCDTKADPVANGLDQAPLRIQLFDTNAAVLPVTNPAYGQVYYRDQDGDLLTGLIPADGSSYLRVSPYAGAYPNDGSTSSTTRPPTTGTVGGRFGYLSTTSTVEQQVTAHVGGSTLASDPTVVDAITFTPQVQAGAQAGPGFYVTGCADYSGNNYCRIAPTSATSPGLFLTSDPDTNELRIGLQFATVARTSLTSLPLQQVAGQPEHTVAASPLIINNGELHLNTTSGFQPADTIDTWLITHGTQLPVRAVRVAGGN